MAIIKRSSCEDSIDRFNHTWLVVILLILATLTFFIPFGLHHAGHTASGGGAAPPQALTKYSSNCLGPAHFTSNMIDYTNSACTAAFARSRSINPLPINNDSGGILATVSRNPSGVDTQRTDNNVSETITVEHTDKGNYDFILENTPLFIFVAAVVLKFAHALFVIFISCYGVNLGSLAVTWRGLLSDAERGGQLAFLQDLSRKLKTSRWLSLCYLAYKLIICILCVIVASVLYFIMMQRVYLLDGNHHLGKQDNAVQPRSESVKRTCDLSVVTSGTTHTYTVQCMFTATVQSDDYSRMVQLYKPFYTALLFAFVIITLVNVINWTLWAVKLCRSSKLSLDARLLVCMVAEHGDFTAAEKLGGDLIRVQEGSDRVVDIGKETENL